MAVRWCSMRCWWRWRPGRRAGTGCPRLHRSPRFSFCCCRSALVGCSEYDFYPAVSLRAAVEGDLPLVARGRPHAIALALAGWGIWSLVAERVIAIGMRTALLWWLSDWRPCGKCGSETPCGDGAVRVQFDGDGSDFEFLQQDTPVFPRETLFAGDAPDRSTRR